MATLKKKLEEAQRLKDQAKKAKAEAEKAKIEAEKAREEAEQQGYDIGVAETEDTSGQRSLPYVVSTVLRLGRKLSTELGLRLLLS